MASEVVTTQANTRAGQCRSLVAMFFILAAVLLAADLWLKHWAFENVAGVPVHPTPQTMHDRDLIPPHDQVRLVPNVLSLKLTLNFGAVFGIGQGARTFFLIVTVVAVIIVVTLFWRSPANQRALHIGLSLVLSGALGNMYDRIFCGAVRDMLYLFPGVKLPFGLRWPGGHDELYPWIFNIADVALVVGVGLILLTLLRAPKPPVHEKHT